jgi:glycosyltransferase involved in cell wall biosynthesis
MATGTPVVAASARSLSELIQDGEDGFLFEAGSTTALANRVLEALDRNVSTAARETAAAFSRERCTDRLLSYYERFL